MSDVESAVSRRAFLRTSAAVSAGLAAAGTSVSVQAAQPTAQESAPGGTSGGTVVVDSHCHASPVWYEPIESLIREMDATGVLRAVLVQMNGQFDNDYLFSCLKRFPGRFAAVVLVDPSKVNAAQALEAEARRGASGVRLGGAVRSPGSDPYAIWRAAEALGLSVTSGGVGADFASDDFSSLVQSVPNLSITLEHLGSVNNPTDDPLEPEVRQRIFDLARFPNVSIKVQGLGEFARRALPVRPGSFPFERPIPPYLRQAYDGFGPRRLLWGSDYPPVSGREGYRNALALTMEQFADKSADERALIFGGNALDLFPIR